MGPRADVRDVAGDEAAHRQRLPGRGPVFDRDRVRQISDKQIGRDYLNSWVDSTLADGTVASVRAFGARALHNNPRKRRRQRRGRHRQERLYPQRLHHQDPLEQSLHRCRDRSNHVRNGTGPPDHQARHRCLLARRGRGIRTPAVPAAQHREILAWGGFASVKHVTRYIQPGLELISLDPKFSASVIGAEALSTDEQLREAALRLAVDTGAGNQQFCSSARVAYVVTGDRADAVEHVNRLGDYVYEELMALPTAMSAKPKQYDAELRSNVESARL